MWNVLFYVFVAVIAVVWLLLGRLGVGLFMGVDDNPFDWKGWNRPVLTERGQQWFFSGVSFGGMTLALFLLWVICYVAWKIASFFLGLLAKMFLPNSL